MQSAPASEMKAALYGRKDANNHVNFLNMTESDTALHRRLEALPDQSTSLGGEGVIGSVCVCVCGTETSNDKEQASFRNYADAQLYSVFPQQ